MWQFVLGFVAALVVIRMVSGPATRANRVDHLKNALLSLALMRCRQKDIDADMDMDYGQYDGGKLPHYSGCSVENACMSYIIDRREFRKDPWYTAHMERKIDAIEKYLRTQFDSDAKVVAFFNEFEKLVGPSEG